MNNNQPWKFTCKTCGGHDLNITHILSILAGKDSESWQEWGPLKVDHRWHYDFKEKIEKTDDDIRAERGDFGEFAEVDSDSEPEEYEIIKQESDSDSDEYYVNCASCDREIEFGWSEIDRGGGIFPVECSDFIPDKYLPEPRYVKSWQQKGWLQKESEK
jgi:hypothetical protein